MCQIFRLGKVFYYSLTHLCRNVGAEQKETVKVPLQDQILRRHCDKLNWHWSRPSVSQYNSLGQYMAVASEDCKSFAKLPHWLYSVPLVFLFFL